MLLIALTPTVGEGGSLLSIFIFLVNITAGIIAIALMVSLILLSIRLMRYLGKKLKE